MIKYIGSKRTLVPRIVDLVSSLDGVQHVCDLFTGTTRVAQGLKSAGYLVHANDVATYSEALGRCYVETDASAIDHEHLGALVEHLNNVPGSPGYVTQTFCREARYFQPANGERIDAVRAEIDRLNLGEPLRSIALTSLLEAADRVDSTTGVQMAYLKQWSPRSFNPLELRVPELLPGSGTMTRSDACVLGPTLRDVDLVYLDPPYNQHSYFGNYHVWETIVRGDEPEAYGVARKRTDCRDEANKSPFNSKRAVRDAFTDLVARIPAPHVMVSFNDEGFLSPEDIVSALEARDHEIAVVAVDSKRYVGAQIGIHNLRGERVGEVGRLRNTEYLFVSGPSASAVGADP